MGTRAKGGSKEARWQRCYNPWLYGGGGSKRDGSQTNLDDQGEIGGMKSGDVAGSRYSVLGTVHNDKVVGAMIAVQNNRNQSDLIVRTSNDPRAVIQNNNWPINWDQTNAGQLGMPIDNEDDSGKRKRRCAPSMQQGHVNIMGPQAMNNDDMQQPTDTEMNFLMAGPSFQACQK